MRHKSVAEERPEIRAQWAPINKLSPDQVSCGSHLKVWWICSEGHKWQATVKNRALLGSLLRYPHARILRSCGNAKMDMSGKLGLLIELKVMDALIVPDGGS